MIKLLLLILCSSSYIFGNSTSQQLIQKAYDEQQKINKEREDYIESTLKQRAAHTWYKTDHTLQITGAALLGILWYVSHVRHLAQGKTRDEASSSQTFYSFVRTISLTFAAVTWPVSVWRLLQEIYNDFTIGQRLIAFDESIRDLELSIIFLRQSDMPEPVKKVEPPPVVKKPEPPPEVKKVEPPAEVKKPDPKAPAK